MTEKTLGEGLDKEIVHLVDEFREALRDSIRRKNASNIAFETKEILSYIALVLEDGKTTVEFDVASIKSEFEEALSVLKELLSDVKSDEECRKIGDYFAIVSVYVHELEHLSSHGVLLHNYN